MHVVDVILRGETVFQMGEEFTIHPYENFAERGKYSFWIVLEILENIIS
jgi:hypothetical protein